MNVALNASEPKIAHLFRFPAGGKHLCVPQKNGNRNFGALLHAAWVGSPPADEKDLLEHMHRYDLPAGKLRNGHIYFVARNPYARLLSEFLNHQVGQCVRGSLGCAATTNLPANRTGFETWVSTLYQRWLNSGRDTCKLGNKHLVLATEWLRLPTTGLRSRAAPREAARLVWVPPAPDHSQQRPACGRGLEARLRARPATYPTPRAHASTGLTPPHQRRRRACLWVQYMARQPRISWTCTTRLSLCTTCPSCTPGTLPFSATSTRLHCNTEARPAGGSIEVPQVRVCMWAPLPGQARFRRPWPPWRRNSRSSNDREAQPSVLSLCVWENLAREV